MDYSNYTHHSDHHSHHQAAAYDPSQPSSQYPFDPSTNSVAQPSSNYYCDSQQYASYYQPQDYANYYYSQPQESNHHQPQTQYGQTQHDVYYPQTGQNPVPDSGQTVDVGGQRAISHPIGHFPSRGRGRGRRGGQFSRGGGGRGNIINRSFRPNVQGHGQDGTISTAEPARSLQPNLAIPGQGPVPAAPSKQPKMAWCEVCRVECNTPEILEQHRNGKRHMKNMRVHEELQNLKKQMIVVENVAVQANKQGNDAAEKAQVTENEPMTENEAKTKDRVLGKRKMKGGRGGKFARTNAGSKRPVEPAPPQKQVIPFICELCNVKCESQVVLDSHLTGKKHLSNLKKCQNHGSLVGLQVVYPQASSNPPLASTSATPAVNNPRAAADLGALLAAHGVSSESQVLLAQLIMNYVLSQTQAGSATPVLPSSQASAPAGSDPGVNYQQGPSIDGSQFTIEAGDPDAIGPAGNQPGSAASIPPVDGNEAKAVVEASSEQLPGGQIEQETKEQQPSQ